MLTAVASNTSSLWPALSVAGLSLSLSLSLSSLSVTSTAACPVAPEAFKKQLKDFKEV